MPTDKYLNKIVLNKMTREQFDNLDVKNPDEFYAITDKTKTSGFALFDVIEKDHILTYEESKGLALLGSYVYKEAVAGSRYGYPDFYNKVVAEKEAGTATETTLGENTVTMYVNSNGHIFYDIADKGAVDVFYNTYGVAWYYGVDTENERVFLPRNDWFTQGGTESDVGKFVNAGLPNITGGFVVGRGDSYHCMIDYVDGCFTKSNYGAGLYLTASARDNGHKVSIDASRSNSTYGNSDTVQPKAVKKLFYMCVGNTTNYEGMTDVVNQGMEILEQVNQGIESRANIDITNLSADGKSLIANYSMPDYEAMIEGTMGTGVWAQAMKDSFVVLRVDDPWTEDYYVYVSPNKTTTYVVGRRFDDTNAQTESTSFTFFVPKGWYFTCYGEGVTHYYIYPLKGAN